MPRAAASRGPSVTRPTSASQPCAITHPSFPPDAHLPEEPAGIVTLADITARPPA